MRASREPIGEAWFGDADESRRGVLVKLLDVHERLSVQLHPDNTLAAELHGPGAIGKHEAWVILEAEPGARVALGLKRSVSREALREMAISGSIEEELCWFDVRPGDVIDVPCGTIHAIGGGVTLQPRMALDSPNLLMDEKGAVAAARGDKLAAPANRWWWD
jgi:mannose-6-phosphate isomerase